MKLLYAPWRSAYRVPTNTTGCVFCAQLTSNQDTTHCIIQRFEYCAVMLNIYPYNAGHVLVVPYNHVAELDQLSCQERSNLMHAATISTTVIRTALECEGINLGLNIGKASGGSIPEHIHMHIVPRWIGDTNFLVTVADTKPLSADLTQIYYTLKNAFSVVSSET